jgi:HTH-type transcriptional regulator/antitoxin MqsA
MLTAHHYGVTLAFMDKRKPTTADPVCPKTGAPMRRGARPMTLEYKGANLTFDMPGWYCDTSEESIHTGEDMRVSDRALNRLEAKVEGLPAARSGETPADSGTRRRVDRRRPRAFQKYVAGDLLPSRAIGGVLALLDHDPSGRAVLNTRQRATA